ncbi:MAG: hypothetical protein JSW34_09415 [Candidatus Zixiibacteriota bacterium]|nr:MAG: hypothetical protein JSW34_09415 [candidate division Zixibacteria bacterium]
MKRLKKTAGVLLLLLISLCFISMPVFADHTWTDDPPFDSNSNGHNPPGPKGGPEEPSPGPMRDAGSAIYAELMLDVSFWLVELLGADDLSPLIGNGGPATPTEELYKAKVD